MNREIRFEYGFESVNGTVKKVYHLHEIPNIQQKCDVWNVLPIKYVRQSTGLKDKNGTEIFEGDLVQHDAWNYPFEVIFNDEKARFVCKLQTGLTQYIDYERLIVVGSVV
jgi:uncharacterized phage protein (TIGR01671 family)